MFSVLKFQRAVSIIQELVHTRELPLKKVAEVNTTYPGPGGEEVPLKVFHPRSGYEYTLIIFPGASPTAEEHPALVQLGRAMTRAGFGVYIPRIPPLKDLNLSADATERMIYFYQWLGSREDVNPHKITLMGVSYGGALVLKSLLDRRVQKNPPVSVLVYGTYFDIETALKFLLTGELEGEGGKVYIQPNEWGYVVLFHNYLGMVDVGYSTNQTQKILGLRVKEDAAAVDQALQEVHGKEAELVRGILEGKASPEIRRITELIWKNCRSELKRNSPKYWCQEIRNRVFIMHGANDTMCPYTESIYLADALRDSRLFISHLYEHREIATGKGVFFRLKELLRLVWFLYGYISYTERKIVNVPKFR